MKKEKCQEENLRESVLFLKENNKQKEKKKSVKEQGITLIALVISIIILLILAGIGIRALTGDDSLIARAKQSKFMTDVRSIEEQINLKNMEKEMKEEPEIMFETSERF